MFGKRNRKARLLLLAYCALLLAATGCAVDRGHSCVAPPVKVAPASQPASAAAVLLKVSDIQPMYREVLAIDLSVALRAAQAENLDILTAREQVQAAKGRLQSTVGAALPSVGMTSRYESLDGTARAVQGNLVPAGFNTFQPFAAVQWIANPGQVIYEAIASRKRLYASEQQEQSVIIETLRHAAVQYYDLALAQAHVSTARDAVAEAQELLRINRLRNATGTGVPADVLRAEASLAQREQDMIQEINTFYEASIALAVTLRLDASATLVPKSDKISLFSLVKDDLSLDELVEFAIVYRPNLKAVKRLVEAAASSKGAVWWGSLGPQFQVAYQYGGITGHSENTKPGRGIPNNLIVSPFTANGSFLPNPLANGAVREGISRGSLALDGPKDQTFGMSRQERLDASAIWRFSLSSIGDLKAANALEQQAMIDAERQLVQVKAEVISSWQSSKRYAELVPLTSQQLASAQEALRLTQANLKAGTMTTLDVLQAEDAVNLARLRQAEAIVHFNQAQVNLLAAMGLLRAELIVP